jgi:protein farnesyltransferase subunit beta
MRRPDGTVHRSSEIDVRAPYCAIASAYLVGLEMNDLGKRGRNYVMSCLSYEGGFGAMSGLEAHAGYTYCAIAALETESDYYHDQCHTQLDGDLQIKLTNFAKSLQEFGAFKGRTSKLMDFQQFSGGFLACLGSFSL